MVYSVTSSASLDILKTIRKKLIYELGAENIPIVIVGTKSDLSSQRQVPVEEVKRLIQDWNTDHIEASAKTAQNIGWNYIEFR